MKLSRRASNVLLVMGIFMLFSWSTRGYTWYANDLQSSGYLAFVHLPIILISLIIGGYLTYLGLRGRRATREARSKTSFLASIFQGRSDTRSR